MHYRYNPRMQPHATPYTFYIYSTKLCTQNNSKHCSVKVQSMLKISPKMAKIAASCRQNAFVGLESCWNDFFKIRQNLISHKILWSTHTPTAKVTYRKLQEQFGKAGLRAANNRNTQL